MGTSSMMNKDTSTGTANDTGRNTEVNESDIGRPEQTELKNNDAGDGPGDVRSPIFTYLTPMQQSDMNYGTKLVQITITYEVARETMEDLQGQARSIEANLQEVPAMMRKFIDDAEERFAVAAATYNSKVNAANSASAVAARAGDALAEWAARRTVNILQGRPPPTRHDLSNNDRDYSPTPPEDLERTVDVAAIQDPLIALAITMNKNQSRVFRLTERIKADKARGEKVPVHMSEARTQSRARRIQVGRD